MGAVGKGAVVRVERELCIVGVWCMGLGVGGRGLVMIGGAGVGCGVGSRMVGIGGAGAWC